MCYYNRHRPSWLLQDIFMEAASLLGRAAACSEHALSLPIQQGIVRQLESAGQLLIRKVDVEAKYLNRLEGTSPLCSCIVHHPT